MRQLEVLWLPRRADAIRGSGMRISYAALLLCPLLAGCRVDPSAIRVTSKTGSRGFARQSPVPRFPRTRSAKTPVWCFWCLFRAKIGATYANQLKELQQAKPEKSPVSMRFVRMFKKIMHDDAPHPWVSIPHSRLPVPRSPVPPSSGIYRGVGFAPAPTFPKVRFSALPIGFQPRNLSGKNRSNMSRPAYSVRVYRAAHKVLDPTPRPF
jgi:hypothetical protein